MMDKVDKIDKILSRVSRRYKFESARLVQKDELAGFFKRAYSDQFNEDDFKDAKRTANLWEWANFKNPNIKPGQFPAWICRDSTDGRIVGHFAIMPITLNFNGLSVYAVWGRDLIVLPEFRNLGLGPLLIKNVLNATLNNAHAFLIAGLNDSIYQVYKKFEFTDMGYLPLYVRVNRLIPLMPERFRIKPIARFIRVLGEPIINILNSILALKGGVFNCPVSGIFETERFDRSFDKLWARARNSFQIIVKRDSDSLNWRFVDQPYGKYRIFSLKHGFDTKGYIVLREGFAAGVRLGVISDLFADAADTLTINSLIKFAINYFSSRDDIGLIRCDMLNKKFEKSIKKFGFIKVKSSLRFMFTNLHDSLDPMFAADLENWFIDYADSDLDLSGRR